MLDYGDSVLFYSDGLVEAHNPEGEMFGFPRLRSLVAERAAEEGSLVDLLMDELRSFTGDGWEQEDDMVTISEVLPGCLNSAYSLKCPEDAFSEARIQDPT